MDSSVDKYGAWSIVGDNILVHAIDSHITEFLPQDEIDDLTAFIDQVFTVNHINTDGSMVITKETKCADGLIVGHDLAIFPAGAELV